YSSLLEILDDARARYGDRTLLGMRTEGGLEHQWSAPVLARRARAAAWRLRRLGLGSGDRMLTWSPPTPELPALYFGAMLAGVVVVPLDLRMTPEVVTRIAERAATQWLVVGTGPDAPDPGAAGLGYLLQRGLGPLTAEPPDATGSDEDPSFPADWEDQLATWPRPGKDDLFEIVYTSGTTGQPRGVMVTHGNILSTMEATNHIIPPWQHRAVSMLPLSHLFGQLELFYALMIGGDVLYIRSRNPRVIFEAIREHRMTTMVVVPQVLDLFWSAISREVAKQGKERTVERLRTLARRLPYRLRRLIFRRIHAQLGGQMRLFISAAAFLPPSLQEAWEDLGIVVMQGYGATECGFASATSFEEHRRGTVGKPKPPTTLKLAPDGEILVGGPQVFGGYWRDPDATAASLDADGWYHTGDIGRFDDRDNLVLGGRKKNIIVLPNGLNVFPEDIENELRVAGLRGSVVLETAPGRIEAIVLSPDAPPLPTPGAPAAEPLTPDGQRALEARIDDIVKHANAVLGMHQRIVAWRMWPEPDFPRTHTLKIKRAEVRAWVDGESPLAVPDDDPVATPA
ncbi:MAG: AMP-binding protein, partial [Chloroflexi bacterium]|nr:AMP-binding protein [Chloroflexota bacterium]